MARQRRLASEGVANLEEVRYLSVNVSGEHLAMSLPSFELWPVRRWGLYAPPHKNGKPQVWPFQSDAERAAWVAQNPAMRQAVGKRHPAVKAYRRSFARETP